MEEIVAKTELSKEREDHAAVVDLFVTKIVHAHNQNPENTRISEVVLCPSQVDPRLHIQPQRGVCQFLK